MDNCRDLTLHWAEQGALDASRVEEAMRYAGALPDKKEWRHFIDRLLLWGGSVLVAAGVIFFLAYNWGALGRFEKFALVEALLVAALGTSLWLGVVTRSGKAALFTAALLLGALLALFGQTYQTGADTYELFLSWAVFLLPWAAASRQPGLWMLVIALVNISITFYFRAFPGPFGLLFNFERGLWSLFVFNTAALSAWEFFSRYMVWLRSPWATRILGLASAGLITALALVAIFDQDAPLYALFVYPLWVAAIYVFYRMFAFDLFFLASGVLSAIVVTTSLLGRALIEGADSEATLLILAFVVIGLSALSGTWLKNIAHEGRSHDNHNK